MLFQNNPLLSCTDMGVDLRGGDGAVSEHVLNIPDVHILLQQERRKGVTEHMWGNVLPNAGLPGVFLNHIAD